MLKSKMAELWRDKEIQVLLMQLTLLNETYPLPHELEHIFKQPVLTNELTSSHIIYYLCTVINRNEFNKLITWPLKDNLSKSKFRIGLRKFIILINKSQGDVKLPLILQTVLMKPKSSQYISFIFELASCTFEYYLINKLDIYNIPKLPLDDYPDVFLMKMQSSIYSYATEKVKENSKLCVLDKLKSENQLLDENLERATSELLTLLADRIPNVSESSLNTDASYDALMNWENEIKQLKQERLKLQDQLEDGLRNLNDLKSFNRRNVLCIDGIDLCVKFNKIVLPRVCQNKNVKLIINGKVSLEGILAAEELILQMICQLISFSDTSSFSDLQPKLESELENIKGLTSSLAEIYDLFRSRINQIQNNSLKLFHEIKENSDTSNQRLSLLCKSFNLELENEGDDCSLNLSSITNGGMLEFLKETKQKLLEDKSQSGQLSDIENLSSVQSDKVGTHSSEVSQHSAVDSFNCNEVSNKTRKWKLSNLQNSCTSPLARSVLEKQTWDSPLSSTIQQPLQSSSPLSYNGYIQSESLKNMIETDESFEKSINNSFWEESNDTEESDGSFVKFPPAVPLSGRLSLTKIINKYQDIKRRIIMND
ncbi:uncharacterized protein LOC106662894 [Cimex lectularius]|uniref:HAUS augmin-like complex subunit 6 N-terminal domain-containing protein n=1 Tax=Cimex lectularius TaxID=79782 RepID=A0A8I6RFF5_CIMLE|nr:uncharacterized protein LOC106662894 [Cimex lectularius]XP_014242821.1 uncharacterized protein LOC106662894 [Cimex lectularius]